MTAAEVIARARALGIVLEQTGSRLRYKARPGVMTLELKQALLDRKTAILKQLEQPLAVTGPAIPQRARLRGVEETGDQQRYIAGGTDDDLREPFATARSMFDHHLGEHVRRLANIQLPAAILEALNERAAILEHDAGDASAEAWARAVRLEQCRCCKHFVSGPVQPLGGVGTCVVGGWAQQPESAPAAPQEPCWEWCECD